MKVIGYIIFFFIFIMLTFFGIDPVVFADGVLKERMLTLAIVVLAYIVWFFLFRFWLKRQKESKK
jgi:membrane protein DedA with SNARE-associated domain